MIKYQSPNCSSQKTKGYAEKHIPKLGTILSVAGKRYTSKRGTVTCNHEVVEVRGFNGKAAFEGVCWGYGGAGPHALIDVLLLCGISQKISEIIAFTAPRNDLDGIDWSYNFQTHLYKSIATRSIKIERYL